MVNLGVNVDHIATLRQQRKGAIPNVYSASLAARKGGADHIVMHLREDRRHIQAHDVERMAMNAKPFSLEMAATVEMEAVAIKCRSSNTPSSLISVCLVPERREELTTEGGLNLEHRPSSFDPLIKNLHTAGIHVSLFIDPTEQAVNAAKQLGADAVELHTGAYADADNEATEQKELQLLHKAADLVLKLGMHLHAGHGLDYTNVKPVAQIPGMEELNIGFSIVARAVFVGMEQAVREMKELIN